MVFAWVDKYRIYLIGTGGLVEEEVAVSRQLWRQVAAYVNLDSHTVDLDIPQPVPHSEYQSATMIVPWLWGEYQGKPCKYFQMRSIPLVNLVYQSGQVNYGIIPCTALGIRPFDL